MRSICEQICGNVDGGVSSDTRKAASALVEVDQQDPLLCEARHRVRDVAGDKAGSRPALARHEGQDLGLVRVARQALGLRAPQCFA
jgi:hypothetical protein